MTKRFVEGRRLHRMRVLTSIAALLVALAAAGCVTWPLPAGGERRLYMPTAGTGRNEVRNPLSASALPPHHDVRV
jgi:hypothetical protein